MPGGRPYAWRTRKLTPPALGYVAENRANVSAIGSEASDRITHASSDAGPAFSSAMPGTTSTPAPTSEDR